MWYTVLLGSLRKINSKKFQLTKTYCLKVQNSKFYFETFEHRFEVLERRPLKKQTYIHTYYCDKDTFSLGFCFLPKENRHLLRTIYNQKYHFHNWPNTKTKVMGPMALCDFFTPLYIFELQLWALDTSLPVFLSVHLKWVESKWNLDCPYLYLYRRNIYPT